MSPENVDHEAHEQENFRSLVRSRDPRGAFNPQLISADVPLRYLWSNTMQTEPPEKY
jgi:hypothetical protein